MHQDTHAFQETVWDYYRHHGRDNLPWRQPPFDPYNIMVSELMLQQTQVQRVIPKYQTFLELFPTVQSLASAELGDVLRAWTGLGYNRRAKFLHQAAMQVGATFPTDVVGLVRLPGVGVNTAGAIAAYAYNQPVVFIETNIRTVIIHHFFHDHTDISDTDILAIASEVLDQEHPRDWYWALMDYGSFLKQTVGNVNRQSKSYAKQSTFAGSKRQVRGQVISMLGQNALPLEALQVTITDERLRVVLDDLLSEGLIRQLPGGLYSL